MIDQDIEARIRKILLALQLLQEGRTVNFDPKTKSGKAGDRPPAGFRDPFRIDKETGEVTVNQGPPSKDVSLFAFYSYWFAREQNDGRRRLFCYLAERDYHNTVKPMQRRRAGSHTAGSEESTVDRDKRILSMYQGVHALEAAVFENCSEAHIRKLRVSPTYSDGHEKPQYDATMGWELDDAEMAA